MSVVDDPDRPILQMLERSLQAKSLLLVLDNCEHLVVGCAATVEGLLKACASLTVLATSREPLNLAGEIVRRLSPLEPSDAAALFVERASAAEPAFGTKATEPRWCRASAASSTVCPCRLSWPRPTCARSPCRS